MNSIKGLFASGSCFSFLGFRWTQRVTAGIIAATLGTCTLTAGPKIDMSRLVVVGDSLSAGYQNMSLLDTQQAKGYAALVAKQANVPMTLPLIAYPGIPNVLVLDNLGVHQVVAAPSIGREECQPPYYAPCPMPTNLAVPAARVDDILHMLPSLAPPDPTAPPAQGFTSLILGFPGLLRGVSKTQIEWAETMNPTAMIVWAGANDVLLPAWLDGSATNVTNPVSFARSYAELLSRAVKTKAKVITANIPDVTATAAFLTIDQAAAQLGAPSVAIIGLAKVPPGSLIKIDSLPLLGQVLLSGGQIPYEGKNYLDPVELTIIKGATLAYNLIISQTADQLNVPVVDVNQLVNTLSRNGIVVNGQLLTTAYLGGLYSLDGVHPTDVGYAIIANEFIKTINRSYSASIPPVSLPQVAKADPLVVTKAKTQH